MTDRRTVMPDLTIEWFKTAMHPRHAVDGTKTYVLTPPRRSGDIGPLGRVALLLLFIGAVVGAPLWFVIK